MNYKFYYLESKNHMIYINSKPINITIFPDKTSQVWKLENIKEELITVEWRFENEGEFMQLAQLKALLETMEKSTIDLYLPYLPYGRQDKTISNFATFALLPFTELINTLNFNNVLIEDPHSEVALNLIHNSKAIYPVDRVLELFKERDLLCYPDKGALSKYRDIYKCSYMYGEKQRDPLTGNILSYEIKGQPVKDKKVLIVDDICDGGMTFKLLAKALLEAEAKEVDLFVSHGIFSKGVETLRESGIKRIFTKEGEVV